MGEGGKPSIQVLLVFCTERLSLRAGDTHFGAQYIDRIGGGVGGSPDRFYVSVFILL